MQIKRINDTQISNAIDLIWATFIQFEAPDYSEEGIQSFKDFIENREMIKTLEFWGAIMSDSSLPGKIRTRLSWRNWKGSSTSISFPVN